VSVHTPSRALQRVTKPSILLGYNIGSGMTDEGDSVEIHGSGRIIRFRVSLADGRSAEYDLDIQPHANAAIELAKAEA
jgi:hypothetical protein